MKTKSKIIETCIRNIVRFMLTEDRKDFLDDTKDIYFKSDLNDPLFTKPKNRKYKNLARDVKRSWNKNIGKSGDPARVAIQGLKKIHWIWVDADTIEDYTRKIDRLLNADRRGELSAILYKSNKHLADLLSHEKQSGGVVGLEIDGWVSLAAKSMDAIYSGFFGSKEIPPNTKIPRRPTRFNSASAKSYIFDPKDIKEKMSYNEGFVANWKPVAWVVGPYFLSKKDGPPNDAELFHNVMKKLKSTGLTIKYYNEQ